MSERAFNFSAGPAVLPLPVLEQARDEFLNYGGFGMSVMEMSHRSKMFIDIMDQAEAGLRRILAIPDDYVILFLQGGASLQFLMAPLNLYLEGRPVDLIHTGTWTQKAIVELEKVASCTIAASTEAENFTRLPAYDEITLNESASYVHLASNNTVFGTQWRDFPDTGGVPLVADMSSDILSREIDVSRFGLIFAGAQKNMGPAGVTIVILRPELAERASTSQPTFLQYRSHIRTRSLYNTPPTYGIYIVGLITDWIEAQGGIPAIQRANTARAGKVYELIDSTQFYTCPVAESDRSRMNIVFRIEAGNEALEEKFVEEAEAAGLSNLKGHRYVGGLRASLYNAQTFEAVEALVEFMKQFEAKYG